MKHLNNYTLHINFDVEKPFIRMYYLVLIWGREIQPCPVLKEADLYKPQPPSLRLLAGFPNGRQRQNRGWEEEKKSRYLPRPAPPLQPKPLSGSPSSWLYLCWIPVTPEDSRLWTHLPSHLFLGPNFWQSCEFLFLGFVFFLPVFGPFFHVRRVKESLAWNSTFTIHRD